MSIKGGHFLLFNRLLFDKLFDGQKFGRKHRAE
jgi:hypothetical protein